MNQPQQQYHQHTEQQMANNLSNISCSSANGNTSSSSLASMVPGGVITTQNISTVIKPKENNNSMQFVKITPPDLSKKAVEQIRVAQESKITKDKLKEVEEEWQTNLNKWKSKRRQHFVGPSSNGGEQNNNDLENSSGRKVKTFAEMIEQRARSNNTRLKFNLNRYIGSGDEDDANDTEETLTNNTKSNANHSNSPDNNDAVSSTASDTDQVDSIQVDPTSIRQVNKDNDDEVNLNHSVLDQYKLADDLEHQSNPQQKSTQNKTSPIDKLNNIDNDIRNTDNNTDDNTTAKPQLPHKSKAQLRSNSELPRRQPELKPLPRPPTSPKPHLEALKQKFESLNQQPPAPPLYRPSFNNHYQPRKELMSPPQRTPPKPEDTTQKQLQRVAIPPPEIPPTRAVAPLSSISPTKDVNKEVASKSRTAPLPQLSQVSPTRESYNKELAANEDQFHHNHQSPPQRPPRHEQDTPRSIESQQTLSQTEKMQPSSPRTPAANPSYTSSHQHRLQPQTVSHPPVALIDPPEVPQTHVKNDLHHVNNNNNNNNHTGQPNHNNPLNNHLPRQRQHQHHSPPQLQHQQQQQQDRHHNNNNNHVPSHQHLHHHQHNQTQQPPLPSPQQHQQPPASMVQQTPKAPSPPLPPLKQKEDKDRTVLSVSGKRRCSSCREELGRGAAAFVVESLNLVYHTNCFKCSVCHVDLSNGFRGVDVRVHAGALHCQNCYSKDGLNYSRV